VDDKRIYDAYIAGRQSAALAAGVRVGLFDLLDAGPLRVDEVAARLGLAVRGVRQLTRALVAMGLLEREGDRLRLAGDARAYLVPGRPGWLGGLIDLEVESYLSPQMLLDALQRNDASVYGEEDPWERHARDPERARAFTRAMHSISERPAAALADALDLEGVATLVDVGGGSGAVSIALARRWPELRCIVWDLATVCEAAREYAQSAGLSSRIETLEGDFFSDPYPRGAQAVLFSQILHDWSPARCRELLAGAFDALPPGGLAIIHEKLAGADAPLANALVDLDMLVWTEGQQWEQEGLRELLESVGFDRVECRSTIGYWSAITARRPAGPATEPGRRSAPGRS
jgi:predicted O-methyltransferase YrrM